MGLLSRWPLGPRIVTARNDASTKATFNFNHASLTSTTFILGTVVQETRLDIMV